MKKEYTKPEFVVSDTTQQFTEDDLGAIATQYTANKLEFVTAERDTLLHQFNESQKELDNLREGIVRANEQLTKARKDREAIAEQLRRAETQLADLRNRKAEVVELLYEAREDIERLKHRSLIQRILNTGV